MLQKGKAPGKARQRASRYCEHRCIAMSFAPMAQPLGVLLACTLLASVTAATDSFQDDPPVDDDSLSNEKSDASVALVLAGPVACLVCFCFALCTSWAACCCANSTDPVEQKEKGSRCGQRFCLVFAFGVLLAVGSVPWQGNTFDDDFNNLLQLPDTSTIQHASLDSGAAPMSAAPCHVSDNGDDAAAMMGPLPAHTALLHTLGRRMSAFDDDDAPSAGLWAAPWVTMAFWPGEAPFGFTSATYTVPTGELQQLLGVVVGVTLELSAPALSLPRTLVTIAAGCLLLAALLSWCETRSYKTRQSFITLLCVLGQLLFLLLVLDCASHLLRLPLLLLSCSAFAAGGCTIGALASYNSSSATWSISASGTVKGVSLACTVGPFNASTTDVWMWVAIGGAFFSCLCGFMALRLRGLRDVPPTAGGRPRSTVGMSPMGTRLLDDETGRRGNRRRRRRRRRRTSPDPQRPPPVYAASTTAQPPRPIANAYAPAPTAGAVYAPAPTAYAPPAAPLKPMYGDPSLPPAASAPGGYHQGASCPQCGALLSGQHRFCGACGYDSQV